VTENMCDNPVLCCVFSPAPRRSPRRNKGLLSPSKSPSTHANTEDVASSSPGQKRKTDSAGVGNGALSPIVRAIKSPKSVKTGKGKSVSDFAPPPGRDFAPPPAHPAPLPIPIIQRFSMSLTDDKVTQLLAKGKVEQELRDQLDRGDDAAQQLAAATAAASSSSNSLMSAQQSTPQKRHTWSKYAFSDDAMTCLVAMLDFSNVIFATPGNHRAGGKSLSVLYEEVAPHVFKRLYRDDPTS
jgi:hypothetical protein